MRTLAAITADLELLVGELKSRPETFDAHTVADLQAAIAASKPGDVIRLDPGVRYVTGELVLPPKDGTVTIRSSALLPERRITPADAPLLPILASGNNGRVINGTSAANWTLDGIAFESSANGAGEVIVLQDASNITLDRVLIVGGPNGQKRAIRGNGKRIILTRSHIANIWAFQQDSQAFCAWDGAGPYTITDNYLEAAGENVMFGGADSQSVDRLPSDITIADNLFTKSLAWKGVSNKYSVKNLLELKSATRVTIRQNVFERSWTDAQNGYAILFKSVNQNGTAPWSATEDVLCEGNTIREAENGFNIQGETFEQNPNGTSQHGGRTTGIVIRGNDVQVSGVAVQISGAPGTVAIDRTTFVNGWTFLQLTGSPMQSLTVTNTLANHNAYGVKGDGAGIGTASLTKFASAWSWANNVLLGGAGKGTYPATTYYDLASVPAGVVVGR